MIVTRLIGGLGNQMFQYAFGLHFAEQIDGQLFLDASGFKNYSLRPLMIDRLAISAPHLPETAHNRIPGRYRGQSRIEELASRVASLLPNDNPASLKLLREKPFGFDFKYLNYQDNVYLDGYWQSESFFPGMKSRLCREFSPKEELSPPSKKLAAKMRNSESVAIHVRRGDYVTNPDAQKIYRNLDAAYYRRCLEDLARNADSLCVYLFSDDIDWCLKNLEIGRPLIPVVHNDASMAYEDLQLMRYCRHAIIANSSFSWWGAYLGEDHAQRRVYYPDPWFNNGVLNDKWIGCAGWINEKTLHGHDE